MLPLDRQPRTGGDRRCREPGTTETPDEALVEGTTAEIGSRFGRVSRLLSAVGRRWPPRHAKAHAHSEREIARAAQRLLCPEVLFFFW